MEIPDVPSKIQCELGKKLVELRQIITTASSELETIENKVSDLMES